MRTGLALVSAVALSSACGGAKESISSTVTITVTTTASATSPVIAGLEPESCTPVVRGADGNVSPVACPGGHPYSYAQVQLTQVAPEMLALGRFASADYVSAAGCSDLHSGSTNPIETSAYVFAKALNGWSFGVDPSDGGLWTGCS